MSQTSTQRVYIMIRLPLALLLVISSLSHAELYSWVDENGSRHYSDQEPTTVNAKPMAHNSRVNYYSASLAAEKKAKPEQQPEHLGVSHKTKNGHKPMSEQQCQEAYRLSCDRVVNWRQYALEQCGNEDRCLDEAFLARKYKPVSVAEQSQRTLRTSARRNRQEREIRHFIQRKYTPYCKQQAQLYCQDKVGRQCRKDMEAACKDPRSLNQFLAQYNLSDTQRQQILEHAKTVVEQQESDNINMLVSRLMDLIVLQAIGI